MPQKCTVKNGDLYIIIFINVHKCTRGEGGLRKSSLCTVVIMIDGRHVNTTTLHTDDRLESKLTQKTAFFSKFLKDFNQFYANIGNKGLQTTE